MTHLVNKLLIARVLANNHHTNIDNIEVQTSDVKLSSTNGENFCSDIYVAKVTYKLNGNDLQSSFIVKIMRPEIAEIGTNEEQMFTRVLPTMEGFFNRLRNAKIKLYPRCFLTEKVDGHEFYVLEDLNTMGYFCADRIRGLDEAHARLLMQKIGQFHAASLMYEKKFPEIVNSLGKSHFANGATDVVAEAIAFGGMEYVANMIETWAGYEQLSSKIRSLSARFNDKVKKVVDPQNSVVNVITHGDLWINNVLFRNEADTKHPIDVLFVDFQNSFWGGCGYDLNYFIYTSLQLPVLKEKRLELIEAYYVALKTDLQKIGYPLEYIPKWKDILDEIKRSELIGLYCSLCELPLIALRRTTAQHFTLQTFEQPQEMARMRLIMYDNERVRDMLLYTLKYFEEAGVL